MWFQSATQFEFGVLDPGKVCAIVSTHFPSESDSASEQTKYRRLYASLLDRLKRLYPPGSSTFESIEIDFTLCEVFTVQVLFSTSTFASDESRQYYAPILDMFSNARVRLDLDCYFCLCHDMKWDIFAAYLISQKAIPNFVQLALEKASDSNQSTLLTLKRCIFMLGKTSENTVELTKASQLLDSQLASKSPNDLCVKVHESLNELVYHIDLIISQLFASLNEAPQQVADTINANENVYFELTTRTAALLDQCHGQNIAVSDLQSGYLLWTALLRHLNLVYSCREIECSDVSALSSTIDKYSFLWKLIQLYKHRQSSIFSTASNRHYYAFLCRLLYSLLVSNLALYHDCPLFDSIPQIQAEYDQTNFDRVDHLLKGDQFWSQLLSSSTADDNLSNLFRIVDQLQNHHLSASNRLEQLLIFTLTILSRNRIANSSYFEALFQQRVALYGIEKIPLSSESSFGRNLIKEAAFAKVKVDWHSAKLQKLALDIILSAFISPLETIDSLLNSALIFSPLNHNHFIVHLLCHHLRPLSQFSSFVTDILTGNKLNLVASMSVLKCQQSFDILSTDSLNDFLRLLTKSGAFHFEPLLANLLAYSNVQAANISLHWLQSICDLVKHSQFTSSDPHNFTVISAFLLKLLHAVWNDQTKKEIVISILQTYTHKNVTKLSVDKVKQIGHLLRQSTSGTDFNVLYLLFYLEESFSFPPAKVLQTKSVRSILHYAAISNNAEWLVPTLATHSNFIFDQLYLVLSDIVLCLTQKELLNLITLLSKMYSKVHILLVVSLVLAAKLDSVQADSADSLVYFCRSLFALIEQLPAELDSQQADSHSKSQLHSELLYIFFVWSCIQSKLNRLKGAIGLGNEVCLEAKKVVHSVEREVKEEKWKVDGEITADYIDDVYRDFREQLRRTSDQTGWPFTGFDDHLMASWNKLSQRGKVKTTIIECK